MRSRRGRTSQAWRQLLNAEGGGEFLAEKLPMRMRGVLVLAALPIVLGLLGVMPRPTQLDLAVTASVVLCVLALMGQAWGRYPQWRREHPADEPEFPPAL